MLLIFAAFILVPIAEITLLIKVGGWIGTWETVGLVILTAVIGTALVRAQGFTVMLKAQDALERGVFPARELFDGACILVAGVLLITPGFITDTLGFVLLVPVLRFWIGRAVWTAMLRSRNIHVETAEFRSSRGEDEIIEGEFHEVARDRDKLESREDEDERKP